MQQHISSYNMLHCTTVTESATPTITIIFIFDKMIDRSVCM